MKKAKYLQYFIQSEVVSNGRTGGIVYESREHEKAWIIRCTINTCKDVLKSAYHKKTTVTDNIWKTPPPKQENAAVREAVMNLPKNYRIAIFLYYFEGYSTKEIAEMTGKSENSVALQLSRGRRRLSQSLKEYGKERMRYYGKNMEG